MSLTVRGNFDNRNSLYLLCYRQHKVHVHRKRRVLSILPTLGVLFVLWWEVLRILHHTVPGTKTSGLTTRRHLLCKSFKRISKSTISPRCTGLTCYVSTSLPHHNTNSISQAGVVRSFKIGHV